LTLREKEKPLKIVKKIWDWLMGRIECPSCHKITAKTRTVRMLSRDYNDYRISLGGSRVRRAEYILTCSSCGYEKKFEDDHYESEWFG
jgi:DNA-directed RNA polymerase subunit M/transcription elongation factor TFIIS